MDQDRGSRRGRKHRLGRAPAEPFEYAIDDDEVADGAVCDGDLLADDDAWNRIGEELRRVDAQRYLAILKLAEDICSIHREPLAPVAATGHFVFPKKKQQLLD